MSESLSFNFRVLRDDRKKLARREVVVVLRFFLDHQRAPRGYRIEATQWRRKNKAAKRPANAKAAADAMQQFWYMLHTQGLAGLRLGSVKRDVL